MGMKQCPRCGLVLTDDNDFCLEDGTRLVMDSGNQVFGGFQMSDEVPTQVVNRMSPTNPQLIGQPVPVRGGSNTSQFLIFGVILLLAMASVGFGVAYFFSAKKNEASNVNTNVNSRSQQDEEKRKVDEQKTQLEADNSRLTEERKRLEAERQKVAQQIQSSGPLPPSTSALIFDPPTNIRATPNGKVVCVISSRTVVGIVNTPSIADKNGVWYRTTACGGLAFVHSSQVSFNY
jgi:hypothetical protein